MKIVIRQEENKDFDIVESIVEEAFKEAEHSDHLEHKLVKRLRDSVAFIPELSLVAIDNDNIVGHILLTKIDIVDGDKITKSLALAPLAVVPSHQKKGIGGMLIEKALEVAKVIGYTSVIVLGHEDYYPRFGFQKASKWSIKAPFEVPDEAFMAIELVPGSLQGANGVVSYAKEFFE